MELKIVVASTNEGKIKEISKTLNSIEDFKITFFSLKDYQNIPEPNEPFESFMDNSIHLDLILFLSQKAMIRLLVNWVLS